MSASRPVGRVVDLLSRSGYVDAGASIAVGDVPFEFSRVLVASDVSLDLVVVVDTLVYPVELRLTRTVEALSRALDIVRSRRTITLILIGPVVREETIRAISRHCRVLRMGTPTGPGADQEVEATLAVLTPLQVPTEHVDAENPLDALRAQFSAEESVVNLIDASERGADVVTDALRIWLTPTAREGERDD